MRINLSIYLSSSYRLQKFADTDRLRVNRRPIRKIDNPAQGGGQDRSVHGTSSREGRGRERSCPDSACRIVVPTCQMLISFERCPSSGPNRTILHAILRSKCMRDVTEHVGRFLSG